MNDKYELILSVQIRSIESSNIEPERDQGTAGKFIRVEIMVHSEWPSYTESDYVTLECYVKL